MLILSGLYNPPFFVYGGYITNNFNSDVEKFKRFVQNERLKQYEIYCNASDSYKEGERQKLIALNNINIKPQTKEELDYLTLIVQDVIELDASKIKTEGNQNKTYKLTDKPKKDHYSRDMNLAFFGPPFLLAFLPVILFVIGAIHGLGCSKGVLGCWFCDFCLSEFMMFWLFSITFTGPIALLIMILCTNAVHKKYGEEPDKLTNAVLLAGAIRCAISNTKALKRSTKNLLDQNGKTEV